MEGWQWFGEGDLNPSNAEEYDANEIERLCVKVFATQDGAKLMEWLVKRYVEVPVAAPGADASYAFFAEGQRNVVRDLIQKVRNARRGN